MWEIVRLNQRRSFWLLVSMSVVLILTGFVFGSLVDQNGGVTGIFLALVLYFILLAVAFSSGSSVILRMSGAKEVSYEEYPQLYNIVEEMRISAGMNVMPKIYVINDPAPNAFATGLHPDKSVVAVTTGLLEMMNRDELQGVIAHEISHIINRDIRYLTIATIMVASVAMISQFFLRSMMYGAGRRRSSDSKGNGGGQAILILIAIVFAILAPFAIRLLYFSLSRKREFLADASGARLTRYPEGLASALEKIGQSVYQLKSADKTTAPMYIANPFRKNGVSLSNLTSTHPPLEQRIRILRAMGTGFSLESYQQAFSSVTQKKNLIPRSAIEQEKSSV